MTWQPIETAPAEVRINGPVLAPRLGESLTKIMWITKDHRLSYVVLRFSQDYGDGPILKYWLRLPEPPE